MIGGQLGAKPGLFEELQHQDPDQVKLAWRDIVTNYTPLSLTKAEDRLPALSGLAKMLLWGTR